MSKIETVCPYCKKANTVEKSSSVDRYGLQDIRCTHCSKSWQGNLSENEGLAKSAPVPSSELAALRVQVRAQLNELTKRINGLIESRAAARPAKFDTNGRAVEKSDEVNREYLNKALENGKRVGVVGSEASAGRRFQTVETIGVGVRTAPGGHFVPDGFEKNDKAQEELAKALANGRPVGFTPRGN